MKEPHVSGTVEVRGLWKPVGVWAEMEEACFLCRHVEARFVENVGSRIVSAIAVARARADSCLGDHQQSTQTKERTAYLQRNLASLDSGQMLVWILCHRRKSGRLVRAQMVCAPGRGNVATCWIHGTMSRALRRHYLRLANTLCDTHITCMWGKSDVTLNHTAAFADEFERTVMEGIAYRKKMDMI